MKIAEANQIDDATNLIIKQIQRYGQGQYEAENIEMKKHFELNQKQQNHFKLDFMFKKTYAEFEYPEDYEFFCGKTIGSSASSKQNCYMCQECGLEGNTILCFECFDQSKHKGHNIKKVEYNASSTCDCGDPSRLKIDGFCQTHQYAPQKQRTLDEIAKANFKKKTLYFFNIFFSICQLFLDQSQSKGMFHKTLKRKIDIFGHCLMTRMNQVNKNRQCINMITSEILLQSLSPEHKKTMTVLDFFFKLYQLPKTSALCRDLLIMLLYRNEQLRQIVTSEYIKNYSSICLSEYYNLSCNLLSNSKMIAGLAQHGTLGKFIYSRKRNEKDLSDAYERYLTDQIYLTSLNKDCAVIYWNYFNDIDGFLEIGNYCEAFTNQQYKIMNQKYYILEQSLLLKMIRVIDFMLKMNQTEFLIKLIKKLFVKIATSQKSSKNNLFFTYERLWTISVYLFLLRENESKFTSDAEEGKSHTELIFGMDQKQMVLYSNLYKELGLNSKEEAREKFSFLFQKILDYLLASDSLSHFKQLLKENLSFVNIYYGNNSSVLFSIDAIYFKVILKMMAYLGQEEVNNHFKQTKDPNQSGYLIVNHNSFFDRIKQLIDDRMRKLSQQIVKRGRQFPELWRQYNLNLVNKGKYTSQVLSLYNHFEVLLNFASQLLECIYSQLPDLVLASKFPNIRTRKYYRDMYMKYYHNLLKSVQDQVGIDKSKFIAIASYLLFDQNEVKREFIESTKSQNSDILLKSRSKGRKVNFELHLNSFKIKFRQKQKGGLFELQNVFESPFEILPKYALFHLIQTDTFNMLTNIFKVFFQNDLINFTKFNDQCNRLIIIIWRISEYSKPHIFKDYFNSFVLSKLNKSNILLSLKKEELMKLNQQKLKFIGKNFKKEILKMDQILNEMGDNEQNNQADDSEQGSNFSDQNYQRYQEQQRNQTIENISPSLQERLNIKPNEVEEELASEKPNYLPKNQLCSSCKMQNQEELFQLCFVKYAYVPHFFDIHPKVKVFYFNSCNHFFHHKCLKIVPQNGQLFECPICQSKFNFLLLSESSLNYSFKELMVDTINDLFKSINLAAFNQKLKEKNLRWFYFKIVNSIVVYILMISTKAHKYFNKLTFLTYRSLINTLQVYMDCQYRQYNERQQLIERRLTLRANSIHSNLLNYLTELLGARIMKHDLFDPEAIRDIQLSYKQASRIQKFLDVVFNYRYLLFIKYGIQAVQPLTAFQLPKNLKKLSTYQGICQCKQKKQKHFLIICLLHHDANAPQPSGCTRCHESFLKNHIASHGNQILMISPDTGNVRYYAYSQELFWMRQLGSLYKNSYQKSIQTMPALISQQFQDKRLFRLDYELYQEILFNFHIRNYFISTKELTIVNIA